MTVNMAAKPLAIVTGATAGIGKACVNKLAEQGFAILLVARNAQKLESCVAKLVQKGFTDCYFLSLDMYQPDSVNEIKTWVKQSRFDLTVLVNNAGGAEKSAPLQGLSDDDWYRTFEINVFNVVRMCRELLPLMGPSGRIINISSVTANEPGHFNPHYSAAKAAQNNFTKHFAQVGAAYGVTVNSVSPGVIETEGWQQHMQKSAGGANADAALQQGRDKASGNIPLKRLGLPDEVASVVAFLASEGAAYMTGCDLTVDGGKRRQL
ncbi:MAG: SDR family oxidoreductase [Gammaproteobacteria bacterium]|nr:SDR family oxidoreductase [Gammaproteobacteria bacterium]